jgi:hypothetical protein
LTAERAQNIDQRIQRIEKGRKEKRVWMIHSLGSGVGTRKKRSNLTQDASRNSLRYNQASHREDAVMAELTFEQKQDHYHKIRRSNYLASLRLEGFDTQPADVDKPLPTREAVLAKYRNTPR